MNLDSQFGQIDIYLFDQLLRGRIRPGLRVLDAGCGGGRNLVYLLREGFDVYAVDADPRAVASVHRLVADLAPHLPPARVRQAAVENMPWDDASMDVVMCSAVLHFARQTDSPQAKEQLADEVSHALDRLALPEVRGPFPLDSLLHK